MEQNFKNVFFAVLQECDQQQNNIDAILLDKLTNAQIDSPEEVLNNIDLIFDAIDRKHADLIAAKQSGMSRAAWMQKEFSEQINKVGDNTTVEILDAVNNSLQGKDVISDNSMGEGKSFAGPEAVEKIRNLDQSLVALTCQAQEEVQSVITDNENTLPDSILMHKTIVDKDPVAFKLVRKIAAVCLMLSDDNSMLLNYANAAVIADRSIFSIQQEYAVGVGECTEADAMENLIDRYAAQLSGMVENLIPKLVDTGMGVLTTLAQAYCPAAVPILNRITPIIKTACTIALTKIIRKGSELIKEQGKALWKKIKSANKAFGETVNKVVSFMKI